MRSYHEWTIRHKRELVDMYPTHTTKQLAVHFNRKRQDIKNKLFRLGLKKTATVSTHTTQKHGNEHTQN